jgi:hypothetical protein
VQRKRSQRQHDRPPRRRFDGADWALTCTSGGTGATFAALYTYDPASGRLNASQGMTYTKQ